MENMQLPLRDLHLPEPVGWWPLAPGWWFLAIIALVALVWGVLRLYRRWRQNAARRYALTQLALHEAQYLEHRNPVVLGKALSALLRRGMLAYAPRHEVAGLTGNRWLEWLDRGMPVPYFHTDGGRSLLALPYRDPKGDFSDVDIDALLSAVRMRLSVPLGGLS